MELARDEVYLLQLAVAKNPGTSPEVLTILAGYEDGKIQNAIVQRADFTKAPDEVGRYLQDANLRMALAFNTNVSEAERNRYFQDLIVTGGNVWDELARNPQTPSEILKALLEQGARKDNIARNPFTPEVLLRRIADDYDYLWDELARNSSTPVDLLFRFINKKPENQNRSNVSIFDLVIDNLSLPTVDRYRLLLEKEEAEKTAKANKLILRRRNNPYDWAQRNAPTIGYRTSNEVTISPTLRSLNRLYNPNTDDLPMLLSEYSQLENAFVRFITLMNPRTPLEILSQAVRSPSWLERYAVAENTVISQEIRLSLTQDSNRIVRAAALTNL